MAGIGTNIAILQDNRILLILREDFEVWALPGGEVDDGESLALSAIREAREETGFDVRLTRLVGIYSTPAWISTNAHIALFAAEIIGGTLHYTPDETLDARFFPVDSLPDNLVWWHAQRIHDAANGIGGSIVCTQDVPWPFDPSMTRQDIYALRDQSGLSRYEFFQRFNHRGPETRDVG